MLGYPVAGSGEAMERGSRRFNFVWYRPADASGRLIELLTDTDGIRHDLAIPPHKIRPHIISAMRADAERLLAPQFAEAVARTPQPFLQAIIDLEAPHLRLTPRTVILGDTAFVARPHVGMGVTKAGDAVVLAAELSAHPDDLDLALENFAARRVGFGAAVIARARALGAYMQAQATASIERAMSERFRTPEAIMANTAVAMDAAAFPPAQPATGGLMSPIQQPPLAEATKAWPEPLRRELAGAFTNGQVGSRSRRPIESGSGICRWRRVSASVSTPMCSTTFGRP